MTDEQDILQTVEQLWKDFDTNGDGKLDVGETKELI